MVEWSNPIFYINAAGCAAAVYSYQKLRRLSKAGEADGAWVPFLGILAVGTFLHFLGDLVDLSDDLDHLFIHVVLLLALVTLAFGLVRSGRET